MTTQNTVNLLIHGYIRELTDCISKDIITLVDIIELCLLFYDSPSVKLLISLMKGRETSNEINILDASTSNFTTLSQQIIGGGWGSSVYPLCAPYCHIPCISSNICISMTELNPNISYDGILCFESHDECSFNYYSSRRFPKLVIYPSKLENTEINDFYSVTSSAQFPRHIICRSGIHVDKYKLTYCSSRNGVIFDYNGNGDLFQLKLNDIDFVSKDFEFQQINENRTDKLWGHKNSAYSYSHSPAHHWLSMEYLSESNKIFAIKNMYDWSQDESIDKAECGIFDFVTNTWIEMSEYKFMFPAKYKTDFRVAICHDRCNEYQIYSVTNYGQVGMFDIMKNEWKLLNSIDINESSMPDTHDRYGFPTPTIWIDDKSKLCTIISGKYFKQYDIRNNHKSTTKWIEVEKLKKNIQDYVMSCSKDKVGYEIDSTGLLI
eukprot:273643_1